MSGLGSVQTKLTGLADRSEAAYGRIRERQPGWLQSISPRHLSGDLDRDLGINIAPHNTARIEQEKLNQRAAELEAQQNADAAAASVGPQAMAVRAQNPGESMYAGGIAGQSLYGRRRGAARRNITG